MSLSATEATVFYSPSERGFFHAAHHGERRAFVPDPDWTAPETEEGQEPPEHPLIEVVTRKSVIPADAVPITEERWRELLEGQAKDSRIVPGKDGAPVLEPVAPKPAELWVAVRRHRNRLLASTDWTQLPDVPSATCERWAAYRQALRDVPQKTRDPAKVAWPKSPE